MFTDIGVTKDLVYGSAPDASGAPVDLKLDLYRPTGDTVAQRPAVRLLAPPSCGGELDPRPEC